MIQRMNLQDQKLIIYIKIRIVTILNKISLQIYRLDQKEYQKINLNSNKKMFNINKINQQKNNKILVNMLVWVIKRKNLTTILNKNQNHLRKNKKINKLIALKKHKK